MASIIKIVFLGVLVCSLFVGCEQSIRRASQDDVEVIGRLIDEFCAAHKFNDGAKLAEFYTDDAMLMPPDEPIAFGKQAIAAWYQRDLDKFDVELVANPEEIKVSDKMAWVRGTFTVKLTPKEGGETIEATFKSISLWRKRPDGSWVFYCDIWNSNIPLPRDQ